MMTAGSFRSTPRKSLTSGSEYGPAGSVLNDGVDVLHGRQGKGVAEGVRTMEKQEILKAFDSLSSSSHKSSRKSTSPMSMSM